jgi:hypothetical protein
MPSHALAAVAAAAAEPVCGSFLSHTGSAVAVGDDEFEVALVYFGFVGVW